MSKTTVPVIASLCTGVLVFGAMFALQQSQAATTDHSVLEAVTESVKSTLDSRSRQLTTQLEAFAATIASNKDFSLKVLVENDRSSSTITEMASNYLKPMHFSVLEILDSTSAILSSGHFPANAGNRSKKAQQLSDTAVACNDNVMGETVLTLQARKKFTIADFTFFVAGGLSLDSSFLAEITPAPNVHLLLKNGESYTGMGTIKSVSALKNSEIIINDKKYLAKSITLPSAGLSDSLLLFIVLER